MPRPYIDQHTQYSASLLPSPDGHQMRLFGAARLEEAVRPFVLTADANAGVLPFVDSFGSGADYGWLDFGGSWSMSKDAGQGIYTDAGAPGAKAVVGSSLWRDYTLRSEIKLNQAGQAGVLVRVSNAGTGPDALNGYYIGINPQSGVLFGGREDGHWTNLASAPAQGLAVGHWYTVIVQAHGSQFEADVTEKGGNTTLGHIAFTDDRFPTGAIGLRDFSASASWRSVHADVEGVHPPRVGRPMMPAGRP